jgi:flavorubredoxin
MSSVTQIADDIFVLTDLDPLDGNSAWLPPRLRGYEPHNKFLVSSHDAAVLIDTGVAAHGASLLESLAPLLDGGGWWCSRPAMSLTASAISR